ncbi:MAG: hypothetical protein QM570_18260 [Planctomycetota bacterium]|jgi:hypothetical protein|nr:hypothetical protein [Planctomycetota bacterium]
MGDFFVRIEAPLLACRELTPGQKIVYAYLRFRQGPNADSWRGRDRMAAELAMARNTFAAACAKLEQVGLLRVVRNPHGGRARANRYEVLPIDALQKGAEFDPFNGAENGSICDPFVMGNGSIPGPETGQFSTENGSKVDPEKKHENEHGKINRTTVASEIHFDRATGRFMGLNGELAQWEQTYRDIDVPAEVAKAEQWARANPHRAKRNWQRFIVNWLGRATKDQRNGKRRNASRPSFADQVSSIGERIEV